MASKISRAKLAGHVAERIATGTPVAEAFTQLAAYLVDTRRTKESELIIRDIEFKLLDYGMIIASVTSARPLSSGAKKISRRMFSVNTITPKKYFCANRLTQKLSPEYDSTFQVDNLTPLLRVS